MKHNKDIQALRGIAIVMVLLQHYANRLPTSDGYHAVFKYFAFWGGVDLFFVISGFVIAGMLVHESDGARKERLSLYRLATFIGQRAKRLLPAAWFWIAVGGIFFSVVPWLDTASFEDEVKSMIAGMTGTANLYWSACVMEGLSNSGCPAPDVNSIHWSLSFEMQFYVVFAIGLWVMPLRRLIALLGIYAACFTAWVMLTQGVSQFSLAWVIRPQGFVLGIALGYYMNRWSAIRLAKPCRIAAGGVCLMALCWASRMLPLWHSIPVISILSAFVVWLAIPGVTASGWLGRLFCWIGDRSYSIYLSHLLVFHAIRLGLVTWGGEAFLDRPSNIVTLTFVLLSFASALAVGDLSWRYIERRAARVSYR